MNAILRHMAVRLWGTAIVGAMVCFLCLPWFGRGIPLSWTMFPVFVILAGCFIGIGWLMNRIGLRSLNRWLKEASVWDQAGRTSNAQSAYDHLLRQLDSFWISPLQRKIAIQRAAGRMARFHIGHALQRDYARQWLASYMRRFPQDTAIAVQWLERLPAMPNPTAKEIEIAEYVGRTHPRNGDIQTRLTTVFLEAGRIDFYAVATYRRCYRNDRLIPAQIRQLSRLLHGASQLDYWILDLYVRAYKEGETDLIDGIAAGVHWLPPVAIHKDTVDAAQDVLARAKWKDTDNAIARFGPPARQPVEAPAKRQRPFDFSAMARATVRSAVDRGHDIFKVLARIVAWTRQRLRWWMVPVPFVALLLVYFLPTRPTPPPIDAPVALSEPQAPAHNDPFTIQVAAYLNASDAQRFVDQLTGNGLDAFWTKASSANRTWYQVKVSHFASKNAARAYGLKLKSQGLIDDFYVANYTAPPASARQPNAP